MSKRMAMVVLVFGWVVQGCMGSAFYVDSRFTVAEERDIQAAADSWEAAGGERFDLVFGQHVAGRELGGSIVKVSGREALAIWPSFESRPTCRAVNIYTWEYERILLNADRIPPGQFRTTIAHELGHHWLRGSHLVDPLALMYDDPVTEVPTAADRRMLVLARQP